MHIGTIPARFGLIWFCGFSWEDLNVIFYQNMPNLHNRYISAERNISQKNPEYMLNYTPCHVAAIKIWAHFDLYYSSNGQSKFHPPFFLFLAWRPSWLEVGINRYNFGRGPYKYHSTKVWLQLAQWFLRRRLKFTTDGDGRQVMAKAHMAFGQVS